MPNKKTFFVANNGPLVFFYMKRPHMDPRIILEIVFELCFKFTDIFEKKKHELTVSQTAVIQF
jgi:hypothetical protein